MLPESCYAPASQVSAKVVEGEAVLLNVETGAYFSLNKVGTHIWELYSQGKTLAEVVDGVCQRFEVATGRAEADVRLFTETLVQRGLLLPA